MSAFAGARVAVTGSAGVLGTAVAQAFHDAGADVAGIDVLPAPAPWQTVVADLRSPEAARDAARQLGAIDVLANIAGGFAMGPAVADTSDAAWDDMFDINVRTLLNMARAVVPAMRGRRAGKIVNIGARAALRGAGAMGAYCAAKSVVVRLTETLADELKALGINVNCVLPSIIDTPRNRADMPKADFAKWVAPADVAAVVLFLASDGARAVHGAAVPVEGLS